MSSSAVDRRRAQPLIDFAKQMNCVARPGKLDDNCHYDLRDRESSVLNSDVIRNMIVIWSRGPAGMNFVAWCNKISLYYMNLFRLLGECGRSDLQSDILKSFCTPNTHHPSIPHQISLLKTIFSLLARNIDVVADSMIISSELNATLDKIQIQLIHECWKSIIFLLNLANSPTERLCDMNGFFDLFEKIYQQENPNLETIQSLFRYYKICFALMIKKGCEQMAIQMIFKFLRFNSKINLESTNAYCELLMQVLEVFVMRILDTATLENLFEIYQKILEIFAHNNNFPTELDHSTNFLKVLSCIFNNKSDSFKNISSLTTISSDMDVIASRYLAFKILMMCTQAKSDSAGESKSVGSIKAKFTFSDILSHLDDSKDLDKSKILIKTVLFLSKSNGDGWFLINDREKTLECSISPLVPFRFDACPTPCISLLDKRLEKLQIYLNQVANNL